MPGAVAAPQTLYDKVLRDHIVDEREDGTILLYIGKSRQACLCTGCVANSSLFQIAISSTKLLRQYVDSKLRTDWNSY